jgi:2-oxoglutarate ferredoxin oxidoreductase subunit delta
MPKITVNSEWCKGCHICVEVCPRHVLQVDTQVFVRGFHPVRAAKPGDCTVCRQCELLCPDLAITVEDEEGQPASTEGQDPAMLCRQVSRAE